MAPKPAAHGIISDSHVWPAHANWEAIGARADGIHLGADQLFEALDGRTVTTPQGGWFIEIQSIYDEASERWIQLMLTGHPTYTLTFRLDLGADADEAVRRLTMWLTSTQPQDVM